jgi:spore germination protein GerM
MSSDSNPKPSRKVPLLAGGLILSLLTAGLVGFSTLSGCKHDVLKGFTNNTPVSREAVTVFFSKSQGNHSIVENVVRKLPSDAQNNPLEFAMKELLKGPTPEEKNQGFYSEIPAGTALLGLNQNNDTITINFSKQFSSGGGSTSMIQRLEQVKQTAHSVDTNHQIALAVEGKPLETLGGEGLETTETLKREQQ